MNQKQAILTLLNQGPQKVGDFLRFTWYDKSGKFQSLAAEYRARISELRGEGHDIRYNRETKEYTRENETAGLFFLDSD